MQKDRQKLLDTLFANGYTSEKEILKIGLTEILAMEIKIPQMFLLDSLQTAIRQQKLLEWVAGQPAQTVDTQE